MGYEKIQGINRFNYKDLLIAIFLAILTAILGYFYMVEGVCGVYNDDGIYVIMGKALSQGSGYRLINLPDSPLQSKYPIIYPFVLSLIWKIWPSFPDNLIVMQYLNLLLGSTAIGLVYLYMIRYRYFTRSIALASGLLTATSSSFLYHSTITLSESLFLFIMIIMFFIFEEQFRRNIFNRKNQLLSGAFLALPFLTRSIGIIFIPVGLFVFILHKKPILLFILGTTLISLPWILWMLLFQRFDQSIVTTWYTNYFDWWNYTFYNIFKVFFYNLIYIATSTFHIGISILHDFFKLSIWFIPTSLTLWLLFFYSSSKKIGFDKPLPYFLLSYLLFILVWPWPPYRRLIPIIAFLIAYLLGGLLNIFVRYERSLAFRLLVIALFIICLFGNINSVIKLSRSNNTMNFPYLSETENSVSWSSYNEIFEWIKVNTKNTDVIATGLDSMIYLFTGRQSYRPFVMRSGPLFYGQNLSPQTLDEQIRFFKIHKPQYLVETPMPFFAEEKPFELIIEKIKKIYPSFIKLVFTAKDERFKIYRLHDY